MNQKSIFIALALAVATGAIAFAAGVKIRELQQIASFKNADSVKSAPLCNITNQFATEMQVEIIESKFTSGTYFIEPKQKGMFFCGDKVRVVSGTYRPLFSKLHQLKRQQIFSQRIHLMPAKATANADERIFS
jgi:hypothetical protein